MNHKSGVEYITVRSNIELHPLDVGAELLREQYLAASPNQLLERAGRLMRTYETSKEPSKLQETIDELLSDPEMLQAALESRRYQLSYEWESPAVQCLNLMLEHSDSRQRKELIGFLRPHPRSLPFRQSQSLTRSWKNERLWKNLPKGLKAFPFDLKSRKTHVVENCIIVTQPWGLLVFDLFGKPTGRVAIPGRYQASQSLKNNLFVATDRGVFQFSLSDEVLTQLGGKSYSLAVYKGELWFENNDKAYRYRPGAGTIRSYQLDHTFALELRNEKLVAIGSDYNSEWEPNGEAFFRTGPGKNSYGRPRDTDNRVIRAGMTGTVVGNELHLTDGTKVKLLEPNTSGERTTLLNDGDNIWVASGYNEMLFVDQERQEVTHFPINLRFSGGGATKESVFFFTSGGLFRYRRETSTFRWFKTPVALGQGRWVWADEPMFLLKDGATAYRFDFDIGKYEKAEIPPKPIRDSSKKRRRKDYLLLGRDVSSRVQGNGGEWLANRRGLLFIPKGSSAQLSVPVARLDEIRDLRACQKALAKPQQIEVATREDFLRYLDHSNPYIRAKAVDAMPDGLCFPELMKVASDPSRDVRVRLVFHLWTVPQPKALELWKALSKTDDETILAYAANGMAKCGVLPAQSVIERALNRNSAMYDDLIYAIVDRGTEETFEWFLKNPKYSDRIGFTERLGQRLASRPDLVDQLIREQRIELWPADSPALISGLKRALHSEDRDILYTAFRAAEQAGSASLADELIKVAKRGDIRRASAIGALRTCAREEHFTQLAELFQNSEPRLGENLLQTILKIAPVRAQDILISLSEDEHLRIRLLVAKGLAVGQDKKRCIGVLRRLAEEDYRVMPQAQVSLCIQGDESARRWVKDNLKSVLGLLPNLPKTADISFLREDLLSLSRQPEYRHLVWLTIQRRPEIADDSYLIWLSKQKDSSQRRFSAYHLDSVENLSALVSQEKQLDVYIAALVSLANKGHQATIQDLEELGETLRKKAQGREEIYPELLRAKNLKFLSKEWLKLDSYPSGVDPEVYDEFRQRIENL